MMSSTQNTGRASKDRGNKTQNSPHNTKSSSEWHKSPDGLNPKVQPTAEQIRMAQIANDTNKSDDPDVKKKVEQIMELTGKPSDSAIIALHDCDNDPDRAVIMLLDGNSSESKWETTGNKRKKSRQQASKGSEQQANSSSGHSQTNHSHVEGSGGGRDHQSGTPNNKENRGERGDRGRGGGGGGDSKGREDFRNRGPPRLSRGNGRSWRNKENEKNERNLEESRRERNVDGRGDKNHEGRSDRNFEGKGDRGGDRNYEGRGERNFEGRERNYDGRPRGGRRGGPRGRGGGMGGGGGREARDSSGGPNLGGGGGGRVRTFQNRSLRDVDSTFPQSIDTWTNSTAEQASNNTNGQSAGIAMGNWSEFQTAEDWSEEDWTEGVQSKQHHFQEKGIKLTETKVFTPSTNVKSSVQPTDSPSPGVQISQTQDRGSLFHKQSVDTTSLQFNGQLPSASPPQQMQASTHPQSSPAGNTSVKTHPSAIPSSGAGPPVVAATAAATFNFSQYAQQAAESIKAAVGIPSSMSSSSSNSAGVLSHSSSSTSNSSVYGSSSLYASSQQQQTGSVPLSSSSSSSAVDQHSHQHQQQVRTVLSSQQQQQAQQQQPTVVQHAHQRQVQQSVGSSVVPASKQTQGLPPRVKSQRPRIPPPSKIPESAVEMPDDAITNLDVQFGALEFGTDSSPFDYTGISKSTYQETVSSSGNHLVGSQASQQQQTQSSVINSHTSSVGTSSLPASSGSHSKETVVSGYSSLVSQQSTPTPASSQQPNSAAHIAKDLSQSSSMVAQQQQQKVSGPESMLLSQSERKSVTQSSYGSQRSSNSSGVDGYTSSYTYSNQPAYPGSNSNSTHPSKMGSSLSHAVDTQQSTQHSYDQSTMSSLNATLASSSSSVGGLSSANLGGTSALGALAASAISTSSSTNTTSVLKNSLSATKTLPSIPPGVPATMLGHQYIMSQAATLPFYGLQQTLYSYEDMQMLQSRMPTLGYYDMQFTAPASLTTGRDPNMANIAYTDADAAAVVTTMSQGQNQSQTHGQTLFNPALPPGYGYYFTGGMMPGSIPHYPPPIFSVPPATNTHGATSNTQYQKATAYNSHSYGSGTGTTADLSNSIYNKSHQQIAKPGVPMGASSTPYTTPPFIPVLAHSQHHSTMMHHHMQDSPQASGNPGSAGGAQRGTAQAMTQPKGPGASNKQNIPYWSN